VQVIHSGLRPEIPADCDAKFNDVLRSCWHSDFNKRPTAAQVAATLGELLAAAH